MGRIDNFGMPFTSLAGDRMYGGNDWRAYYNTLFSDGVLYGVGGTLAVSAQAVPDTTVEVGTGAILINGTVRRFENPNTLVLAANGSASTRIDRIVARVDYAQRKIELAVRQGTPGAGAPALVRSGDIYELSLAQVSLAQGFTAITGAAITDERTDPELCGYARSRALDWREDFSELEDRLDTLEGTGEGSVKKAIDDAVSPLDENKADKATTYTKTEVDVTIDALDTRLGTLEGTGAGSVKQAIDDALEPIEERLTGLDTLVYEGKTYMVSKRIENGHLVTTYTEVI